MSVFCHTFKVPYSVWPVDFLIKAVCDKLLSQVFKTILVARKLDKKHECLNKFTFWCWNSQLCYSNKWQYWHRNWGSSKVLSILKRYFEKKLSSTINVFRRNLLGLDVVYSVVNWHLAFFFFFFLFFMILR